MSPLASATRPARTLAARPASTPPASTPSAWARVALSALTWPARLIENRRLLGAMAAMSDHELADVGLARQDLADTAALPFAAEPGAFLAARAAERRRVTS